MVSDDTHMTYGELRMMEKTQEGLISDQATLHTLQVGGFKYKLT